jgi:hypothetical protein
VVARYRATAEAAMEAEGFRKVMADLGILPKRLGPEGTAGMMWESLAANERIAHLIRIGRFAPQ